MVFIQETIYLKKDGAYVPNLDEYKSIGTDWIDLYVKSNNPAYFDGSGVQHISNEIEKIEDNKTIITSIYKIKINYSIMCG